MFSGKFGVEFFLFIAKRSNQFFVLFLIDGLCRSYGGKHVNRINRIQNTFDLFFRITVTEVGFCFLFLT